MEVPYQLPGVINEGSGAACLSCPFKVSAYFKQVTVVPVPPSPKVISFYLSIEDTFKV